MIADEDQEAWEAYLLETEDEEGRDVGSDDEDSNAEDYYGADYPEDEDSDQNGGASSDDELYYSDDDDDGGDWDEVMMDPFSRQRGIYR